MRVTKVLLALVYGLNVLVMYLYKSAAASEYYKRANTALTVIFYMINLSENVTVVVFKPSFTYCLAVHQLFFVVVRLMLG